MLEPDFEEMLNEMTEDVVESQKLLNQRLWTPKPDYLQFFSQTLLTDAELVDAFVHTTNTWYVDKSNTMFGWQDEVRAELLRCLRENAAAKDTHQLIYAEMKFDEDWIGPKGMFVQYQPEKEKV